MVPLTETNEATGLGYNPNDQRGTDQDVRALYQDVLKLIKPSVLELTFNGEWWGGANGIPLNDDNKRDFHSTPIEHVEYLEKVAPGRLSESTKQWMALCDQQARNQTLNWREPNRPKRL